MSILFLLIPLSLIISGFFVFLSIRAIQKGQYDDMESPKWRMLFDNDEIKNKKQ